MQKWRTRWAELSELSLEKGGEVKEICGVDWFAYGLGCMGNVSMRSRERVFRIVKDVEAMIEDKGLSKL
jgi:hypothetical protein